MRRWPALLLALAAAGTPLSAQAKPPHAPARQAQEAPPPAASGPALYAARTSAQMKVVVDVNAEKRPDGAPAMAMFIFYAHPVEGHDLVANYYVFDCDKGAATLAEKVGVSKYVEPLDLKATGGQPYAVPPGSLVGQVMEVACHGRKAIPQTWTPLSANLRQVSADYYRGYLGQAF